VYEVIALHTKRQDKASSETRLTETRRRTTPARPRFITN